MFLLIKQKLTTSAASAVTNGPASQWILINNLIRLRVSNSELFMPDWEKKFQIKYGDSFNFLNLYFYFVVNFIYLER